MLQAAAFTMFLTSTFVSVEPALRRYRHIGTALAVVFLAAFVISTQ